MRFVLILWLWATQLAAAAPPKVFVAHCESDGTRADVYADRDGAHLLAMVDRGTPLPTMIDARLTEGMLVAAAGWGVPKLPCSSAKRAADDDDFPFVWLDPCMYFLSSPGLVETHSIPELVAMHEAIPFQAHVRCRVNQGSPGAGMPACSEIQIMDRIIPVEPGLTVNCSLGH